MRKGSKQKILDFLLCHIGETVSSVQLQAVSGGVAEWARRLRELRDEDGYQILSNRDRVDLKPREYILLSDHRIPAFKRNISKETRALVLERNGYTCQMCGAGAGDPDPYHPGRTIRLTMGHIIDKSKGGDDTVQNLRAVCSNCNEGLQNASPQKPSFIQLKTQLRRATQEDQMMILQWLCGKFGFGLQKTERKSRKGQDE